MPKKPQEDPREKKTVAEIADFLAEQIESGRYAPGSRLSPAEDIANQQGASRDTVNRAIRQLQGEGLLESRGPETRGVVVSPSKIHLAGLRARFDQELEKQGITAYERNANEPAIVPAPSWAGKLLGVQEGTPVARRFRIQGAVQGSRHIPYRLAENFYLTTLIDQGLLDQMKKDDRFDTLLAIKEKHGQFIVDTHEEIDVRFPRAVERSLLEITPQHPVMEIRRANYAKDGTVVMANKIIIVAAFFTLDQRYSVSYWS